MQITMFVAVQTGEISVTFPQKARNRSTTLSSNVILRYIPCPAMSFLDIYPKDSSTEMLSHPYLILFSFL